MLVDYLISNLEVLSANIRHNQIHYIRSINTNAIDADESKIAEHSVILNIHTRDIFGITV